MTTYAELNQFARGLIGDISGTVFTDLQIDAWINDAIRDISIHFPILKEYDHTTVADQRIYDYEEDFLSAVSVEYPQGEDPPVYLLRRPYTHPDFWSVDGYYDILQPFQSGSSNPPQIYISAKPLDDEHIITKYNGTHNLLSSPNNVTTVPEHLIHLISMFTRWKAWSELASSEGMDPDPIKLLSATQEVNAYRAERGYRAALAEAKKSQSPSASTHTWRMDRFDRRY